LQFEKKRAVALQGLILPFSSRIRTNQETALSACPVAPADGTGVLGAFVVKLLASLMIRYVEVMNMSSSINALVDEFQELPLDDQEYVAEIIAKQLLEFRREHLVDRIAEARANYKTGKSKSGSFDELMEDLEND
jgi:hypothetical protein